MLTLNTDYAAYDVDDPECPTNYARTHESLASQHSIKNLNKTVAIDGYKRILHENLENPVILSKLQNAFDAINSVV